MKFKIYSFLKFIYPGVNAYFQAQKIGLTPVFFEYGGFAQTSAEIKAADPGWIKIDGTCKMAVGRGLMTPDDAAVFATKFKALVEENMVLMLAARAMGVVRKG